MDRENDTANDTAMIISTCKINQSLQQYEIAKEKIVDILSVCSKINERRYLKTLTDLLDEIDFIIAILKNFNRDNSYTNLFKNAKVDIKIKKVEE